MAELILLALAVVPPLAYLLYLVDADRREPEPLHMILFALGLGILSTVPSMAAESLIALVPPFRDVSKEGMSPFGAALVSFIQVAPAEEFFKLAVILLFVWKNPNFNEENDGIVYVTVSAIGFALFENVFYVLQYGFGTGLVRSVTSIPLHVFCGVFMGYFVGKARFAASRGQSRLLIMTGFLVAWAIHGLYDTFAFLRGGALAVILLVLALFAVGRIVVKAGSRISRNRWDQPALAPAIRVDTAAEELERIVGKYGEELIGRDEDGRHYLKPEKLLWKAVAARFLLCSAALIAGIGSYACFRGYGDEGPASFLSFFVFAATVPAVIGLMLEHSYRRRATERHYFS